jgi:hypothetical protein
MSDTDSGQDLLGLVWTSFGKRLAVVAGTLTALISMVFEVPVRISCARGALACLSVLLVVRIGSFVEQHTRAPAEEPGAAGKNE